MVGYCDIFQGLSPVTELNVEAVIEQPSGVFVTVAYVDDGTG